jgi:hypothetical protein
MGTGLQRGRWGGFVGLFVAKRPARASPLDAQRRSIGVQSGPWGHVETSTSGPTMGGPARASSFRSMLTAQTLRATAPGYADTGANGPSLRSAARGSGLRVGVVALSIVLVPACRTSTAVAPSEVTKLIAARADEIRVRRTDGQVVTIVRSDVRQMNLVARDGWTLMMPATGMGPAVPVRDERVDEAEHGGWSEITTLEQPLWLRVDGEMLSVRGKENAAVVSLRDIEHVEVKELDVGLTAFAIGAPIVGAALLVGLFVAECDSCLVTGYPK